MQQPIFMGVVAQDEGRKIDTRPPGREKGFGMAAHFWIASGGAIGLALVGGVALGSYVTRLPSPHLGTAAWTADWAHAAEPAIDDGIDHLSGPAEIRCIGCAPTLAQRQMARDMADHDRTSRVDVDYGEGGRDAPATFDPRQEGRAFDVGYAPPALPANVERFAAGAASRVSPPPAVAATIASAMPSPTRAPVSLAVQGAAP